MSDFVTRNKPGWDELERLVAIARKSVSRMSPDDLHRLDVLYRRASVDLSQVTTRTRDAKLARYLNDLTAAAHSVIYVSAKQPLWKGGLTFLVEGFARSIARTWKFHMAAGALFMLGGVLAFFACLTDPAAGYAMLPAGETRLPGSSREQLESALRAGREQGGGEKAAFASFLFSHNWQVGILAMGLGILAGVPTVFLMLYNGMILGAFTAIHYQVGIHSEYWAWILPHGVTEIGAIVLFGGVGLLLGHAVMSPGIHTRGEALRIAGVDAFRVGMGGGCMLVAAAIIESFLRQSHMSTTSRLAFAIGSTVFWIAYIIHGAIRERASHEHEADPASI